MRFTTFILRNVLRRPTRSTLTITGMAVAVTAVVALVGLSDGFQRSMLQQYVDRGISLIVTKKDAAIINSTIPEKVAHDIEAIPGVTATCAGLLSFNPIDELGSDPLTIQGWPVGNYMFTMLKPVAGRILDATDRGKNAIVVGDELARLKSIKVGDVLTISDAKYHVVGISSSTENIESTMVFMFLEDAQKATGHVNPPEVTGCTVTLKDNTEENVQSVAKLIETTIAESNGLKLKAKAPTEFVNTMNQMRMLRGFAWAVSLIALVIGGIGVLNTMFMSVFERTREIGILRAIGWRPSRVMKMILLESVALSVGAGILGILAGIGTIRLIGLVPVVAGAAHAAITWDIVVMGFLIAVLVGVLGAAYPAFRGSRLLPTEALRHE